MKQKKILFLGGAFSQVPVIKYAKEKGLYVISADYLPENPGHKYSDEYHNISTIDREGILKLSKKLNIDAISAYASDPSAPTAAYVSDEMDLAGSPLKAVEILCDKPRFRRFLKENNYKTPLFLEGSELSVMKKKYDCGEAVLKPVDASGSKGVVKIYNREDLEKNFEFAKNFSLSGKVIVEEWIERKGPQIHGEGFVYDGELVFLKVGDQIFSDVNNLAPYSTIIPGYFHHDHTNELHEIVQSIITRLGFKTGGINVEAIEDKNDELYILEIGARSGGNFMPQLIKHATGFDLVKANVDSLLDTKIHRFETNNVQGHFAQVILHSKRDGYFEGLQIPGELKDSVCEEYIYYKQGDKINTYRNSKDVVGVLILHLSDEQKMDVFSHTIRANNWVNNT